MIDCAHALAHAEMIGISGLYGAVYKFRRSVIFNQHLMQLSLIKPVCELPPHQHDHFLGLLLLLTQSRFLLSCGDCEPSLSSFELTIAISLSRHCRPVHEIT
jgi:hypothetical protein